MLNTLNFFRVSICIPNCFQYCLSTLVNGCRTIPISVSPFGVSYVFVLTVVLGFILRTILNNSRSSSSLVVIPLYSFRNFRAFPHSPVPRSFHSSPPVLEWNIPNDGFLSPDLQGLLISFPTLNCPKQYV